MRFGSTELQGVLTRSFDPTWVADLHYNGQRIRANLPIRDVATKEDAGAEIQQSGSCEVVWTDEFATSISPTSITDPLAPFGAQLRIYSVVDVGTFQERVEFGWFEIVDVPAARDEQMTFRGSLITLGSWVELELKELLHGVSTETFDVPTAPSSLSSVWAEIGRISGLPLSRTVTDASIPRSIMYPENKLKALHSLMDIVLDAAPHMTADGALAARPNTWPEPVDTLTRTGSIISVGSMMSSENVYNRVAVRATGSDQKAILAVAEITTGPLRVRNPDGSISPFRARTLYLSDELITSTTAAAAWAESTLAQVSTPRAQVLPVKEKFNPLRERGDVVLIERPTKTLLGRVATISRNGATQDLTVEIAGEA
jgi:hypothetical protein